MHVRVSAHNLFETLDSRDPSPENAVQDTNAILRVGARTARQVLISEQERRSRKSNA